MGLVLLLVGVGLQNTVQQRGGEYLENPGVVGVGIDGSEGGHGVVIQQLSSVEQ